jgi:hypothetical protein
MHNLLRQIFLTSAKAANRKLNPDPEPDSCLPGCLFLLVCLGLLIGLPLWILSTFN